jgi:two-component system, OmpR family, response regulator
MSCGIGGTASLGRSDEGNQNMAFILIVDTQAQLRQQLARLLESAGHRAAAVATISEAAGILQAQVPDLLATDVVLIDGSSTSLTQQAAALGVKTLMMTGNPDRIIEFDGAGQPYLSKPFPPEVFVKRVEEILAGI